jgi:hypothetical protein
LIFEQHAGSRRLDFGIDLVGGDFEDHVAGGDGLAGIDAPAADSDICNAFAHIGQPDFSSHDLPLSQHPQHGGLDVLLPGQHSSSSGLETGIETGAMPSRRAGALSR